MSILCCVRDAKAENYGMWFVAPNKAVAIRTFTDGVNAGESMLAQHPEDFSLWMSAELAEDTGEAVGVPLRCLLKAVDVVAPFEFGTVTGPQVSADPSLVEKVKQLRANGAGEVSNA